MSALRIALGTAALLALATCLAAPILYFLGDTTEPAFKNIFLAATLAWFLFAWLWARDTRSEPSDG